MGECSALATKQELESLRRQLISLDQEIDGKIDEDNKPEIIQVAAGLGSTAALALLDPRVRQALAKVASLADDVGNLFVKHANVISIISTLASATALTVLQLQVERLRGRVEVLEVLVGGLEIENRNLRKAINANSSRANRAIESANRAVVNANTAIANAALAIQRSELAVTQSNQALRDADKATEKANRAIAKANSNSRKADEAIAAAELATSKANQVISTTNTNADQVTSLSFENAALKQRTDSLTLELATQKAALEEANKKIEDYKIGVTPPVKEYITRKVKESEITTYGDITGLKTSSQQLESSIDKRNREVVRDVKELEKKVVALQTGVLNPGVNNDSDTPGVVGGGGLTVTQAKDIVNTQINSRLGEVSSVNDQQYRDVLDRLKDIPVLTSGAVVGALNPTLTTISDHASLSVDQTTPSAISEAAASGVCSTTQPGGCMNTNVTKPLQDQAGKMINAAGTAYSAANNLLLSDMKGTLGDIGKTVTTIKNVTNTTLGVVQHAKHGLEAIQNFASTAWKAAHGDKVMAGITTALTVHNAMMLSNNLGQTIAEAGSVTLSAIGIKDEQGNAFDIGAIVKGKMTEILTNILGAEQYAALTVRVAKANRIYQASVNVLDTTRALFDSARSIAELTAENTGKIGNALKESGAVYETAYSDFVEKVNPQSAAMRKLERFREGLETVEAGVSTISQISSEVVETKDNFEQLKQEKEEWKKEVETAIEEKAVVKEAEKKEAQVSVDIDELDFDAATSE